MKAQKTIQIAGLYFLGFDTFHVGPRASPLELQVPLHCPALSLRLARLARHPATRGQPECCGLHSAPLEQHVRAGLSQAYLYSCRSPVRPVSVFAGNTVLTQTCTAHTAHCFCSVPPIGRHAVCQTSIRLHGGHQAGRSLANPEPERARPARRRIARSRRSSSGSRPWRRASCPWSRCAPASWSSPCTATTGAARLSPAGPGCCTLTPCKAKLVAHC